MNAALYKATEFTKIKQNVIDRCISDYAKEQLANEQPATSYNMVQKRLTETEEALAILNSNQHVPFMGLSQIKYLTTKIENGAVLEASELTEYSDFLRSFHLLATFFEKNQYQTPKLFRYAKDLTEFKKIITSIQEKVDGNRVKDKASRDLRKIRGKITDIESAIEKNCDKLLKKATANDWAQERLFIKKEERYTLPIKSTFQSKIAGTIIERSNRGTTVFIEPESVRKLNQFIFAKSEETAAVYQILATLTGMIAEEATAIGYCVDIVVELDSIFARGKYSQSIGGKKIAVNDQEELILDQVKHPLLQDPVPLDLTLGVENHGLIITGPNAGGKTIVLKTIALVCLMTGFGLCINHGGNSSIGVFKKIFIDIGDQQSLENSLSTFSGHMQNISSILHQTTDNTLILLDEFGSGTEPNEGAALAIATMAYMYKKQATIVVTTHYGEIKDFALNHEDFQTAAMAFDSETLAPKYQLLLNQVGQSNAFWIAQKMKIYPEILQSAQQYLVDKQYTTTKIEWKKQQRPSKKTASQPVFQKGDRVWSQELKQSGLFYRYQDSDHAQISINKQFFTVLLKRLTLEITREQLYPENYDLDQLFVGFHERKFNKDIDRGSKKAQKQLRKQAENRKNHH